MKRIVELERRVDSISKVMLDEKNQMPLIKIPLKGTAMFGSEIISTNSVLSRHQTVPEAISEINQKIDSLVEYFALQFDKQEAQPEKIIVKPK